MTQVVREEGGFLTHGVWSVIWLSAKGYAQSHPLSTMQLYNQQHLQSWPIRHQLQGHPAICYAIYLLYTKTFSIWKVSIWLKNGLFQKKEN